jgi:hypothetical protein
MLGPKRTFFLVSGFIAFITVGIIPELSLAQFIPCNIVNLGLAPPAIVQLGQPFQVISTLTVSCDPSVFPVIRVDLVDSATSRTISTTALPYYPSSSSFTVSLVNQARAPDSVGSWALQVQAYVISGINGRAVASTSQLFQITITPYAPQITTVQTAETTSMMSSVPSTVSNSFLTSTTSQRTLTQTQQATQIVLYTSQNTADVTTELVPIVLIAILVVAAIGILVFALRKSAV